MECPPPIAVSGTRCTCSKNSVRKGGRGESPEPLSGELVHGGQLPASVERPRFIYDIQFPQFVSGQRDSAWPGPAEEARGRRWSDGGDRALPLRDRLP